MRACTKKWTQRDGTKIRICDMGDDHLLRTIRMLERGHQQELSAAYSASTMFTSECASDAIESDIRGMESVCSDHPLYADLCDEVERRGLVVAQHEDK